MKPSTTVRIAYPTRDERSLLRLLTATEKLAVLLAAARQKADTLTDTHTDTTTPPASE